MKETKRGKIAFDGVPHIILGSKILNCQHGTDRKVAAKRKRKESQKVVLKMLL